MVRDVVSNADNNHSGQIDYTEYLVSAIQKDKLVTKDKLQKAFQSFDLVELNLSQNGDGYISKEEWEKCFGNQKMSQSDWVMFLDEVDVNKDGTISSEEFHAFLEKVILR